MKELTFDARYLNLEISENTLMRDAPAGLTLLHRLSDQTALRLRPASWARSR